MPVEAPGQGVKRGGGGGLGINWAFDATSYLEGVIFDTAQVLVHSAVLQFIVFA